MASRDPGNPWLMATHGLELVGVVGIMTAAGYGLDHWLSSFPIATLIGALVGIGGGLYRFIRDATRMYRSMSRSTDRPKGEGSNDPHR